MAVNVRGRNYLKLLDYTPEEIRYLLDLSKEFKNMKRNGVPHRYLENKNIVLLFEKTSTRTRCAFEVAGMDLGMGVTYLDPGSSQMGKKRVLQIRQGSLAVCMTGSSTGDLTRRSWMSWQSTQVCRCGMD